MFHRRHATAMPSLHLRCSALRRTPSGMLSKDALAIIDMVDAVILAHLVTMNAVVPARIIAHFGLGTRLAALRFRCFGWSENAADAARKLIHHAARPLWYVIFFIFASATGVFR